MTTQYTPGPWRAWPTTARGAGSERKDIISHGSKPWGPAFVAADVGAADSRLIEQAPNLLELLEAAVLRVELANKEGDAILSAWLPDAKLAIARARGEYDAP